MGLCEGRLVLHLGVFGLGLINLQLAIDIALLWALSAQMASVMEPVASDVKRIVGGVVQRCREQPLGWRLLLVQTIDNTVGVAWPKSTILLQGTSSALCPFLRRKA